jgi:hypothetical protein
MAHAEPSLLGPGDQSRLRIVGHADRAGSAIGP